MVGFRRALPTNTGNNLQRTIQAHGLSTTRIYVIAPDPEAFTRRATTEAVEEKKENVQQHLQDTSNRQSVNSCRWLKLPREVRKPYQTPHNVENDPDVGTGRALPSGFTAIHIARYMLIAVLLWNYGPRLLSSSQDVKEGLRELVQGRETYKPDEATMNPIMEQMLDFLGEVWDNVVTLFKKVAHYWDNDPDWYLGSLLSKITPIFLSMSLWTAVIVLAACSIL